MVEKQVVKAVLFDPRHNNGVCMLFAIKSLNLHNLTPIHTVHSFVTVQMPLFFSDS